MTKVFFLLLMGLVFFSLLSLGVLCFVQRKKNVFAIKLIPVFISAAFIMLFYVSTILVTERNAALVLFGLFYLSYDITLFYTFRGGTLIFYRNSNSIVTRIFKLIICCCIAADALALILNVAFENMFTIQGVIDATYNYLSWKVTFHPLFYFHLLLDYVISLVIMILLVKYSVKAPKYFRFRYFFVIATFVLYYVINGFGLVFKWRFNYSILMFLPLTVEIFRMNFYYMEQGILNNLLQSATENFNYGIVCFDYADKCIYLNEFSREFFGKGEEGAKNAEEFFEEWIAFNITEVEKDKHIIISDRNQMVINGEKHLVDIEYHKQYDKKHRHVGSYLRFDDKTAEICQLEEEKYKATHDPLTKLLNREGFFKDLEDLIAENPETPRYIIATDFENFKLINDIFGKDLGDKILKFQAMIMRRGDLKIITSGRISGDKFAFVMNKNTFNAKEVMDYISRVFQITRVVNYQLHIYLGIYEITDPDENVVSMYDKAHMAIQKVRGNHDQFYAFYDTKMMEQLIEEKEIISDFRPALENNQIKMYIQPQVRASTKQIMGGEALVRWEHPEKGFLTPDKFVKTLETNGSIYEMDYFIWESAAKKLAEWQNGDEEIFKNISISVNISTKDFYHADLYKVFTRLVEKYKINPGLLKLEVTETVVVHDVNIFRNVLKHLKKYGFLIEMDDFGSGYSSLTALRDFPMDVLKIDMEFLKKNQNEEISAEIITLIIQMAKKMNMKIITEGVEKIEHVEFLDAAGSDIFQGFYFAKPMPVDQFEDMVRKQSLKGVSENECRLN